MFATVKEFVLRHLVADTPPLAPLERLKAAVGAMLGVILAGGMLALFPTGDIWLVAVLGATAIIVFALPHSPLAQPWSVLGGYLVAAVASLVAASLVPSFLLAAGLALGATVWCMTRFKCMHPPGGALVLVVVSEGVPTLGHAGHILLVALGNAIAILLAALLINNFLLRRSYPQCRVTPVPSPHRGSDLAPGERSGLSHDDIEHAVQSLGSFVDVQEGELVRIFNAAVDHAFERHMATSCRDVMTRDVVTVEFGTDLEDAWNLLRRHKVKALPVVDSFRRIVGIVTVVAASQFKKADRMSLKNIFDAMVLGGRYTLSIGCLVPCIGIMLAIVGLTGLGLKLSFLLTMISGGQIFFAIFLVMLISLILGTGLPAGPTYIITAIMCAPAMLQIGMPLLIVHMILIWYSIDSDVSPPIAVCAMAAAGIAKADPMKTMFTAWKYSKGLFILPFLFYYRPLLLNGPWLDVIITIVTCTIGLIVSAAFLERYLHTRANLYELALLGLSSLLLLWPPLLFNALGLLFLGIVSYSQRRRIATEQRSCPAEEPQLTVP